MIICDNRVRVCDEVWFKLRRALVSVAWHLIIDRVMMTQMRDIAAARRFPAVPRILFIPVKGGLIVILIFVIVVAVLLDAALISDWEIVFVIAILFSRRVLHASGDDGVRGRRGIRAGSGQLSETRVANAQRFTWLVWQKESFGGASVTGDDTAFPTMMSSIHEVENRFFTMHAVRRFGVRNPGGGQLRRIGHRATSFSDEICHTFLDMCHPLWLFGGCCCVHSEWLLPTDYVEPMT